MGFGSLGACSFEIIFILRASGASKS